MNMRSLIESIRLTPDCEVLPSLGMPNSTSEEALPVDLREFYTLCGGLKLFSESVYRVFVVPPAEFVLANPLFGMDLDTTPASDISWEWYIIGNDGSRTQQFTVDLHSVRKGRCYNSFWSSHATPGSCAIIANSFSDFLQRSVAGNGGEYWWERDDFTYLGDAYDKEG